MMESMSRPKSINEQDQQLNLNNIKNLNSFNQAFYGSCIQEGKGD